MKILKRHVLLGAFLLTAGLLQAQPDNPTNPVPLDGGLGVLVAAGATIGYKTLKTKYKKDN